MCCLDAVIPSELKLLQSKVDTKEHINYQDLKVKPLPKVNHQWHSKDSEIKKVSSHWLWVSQHNSCTSCCSMASRPLKPQDMVSSCTEKQLKNDGPLTAAWLTNARHKQNIKQQHFEVQFGSFICQSTCRPIYGMIQNGSAILDSSKIVLSKDL